MAGDTGPPISRKIPGNKFNRSEFIRNSKHNREFFAQVDRFNKINYEKTVADYLNVVIDKSIFLVNSFCCNSSLTPTPKNLQKPSFLFSSVQFVKTFLSVFFCCLINFVKILLNSLKKIVDRFLLKFIYDCKKCAKYLDYFCSALMPMPTLMLATPARGPPTFDTYDSIRVGCKKCARDSFAPLLEFFMPQINQYEPVEVGEHVELNMHIKNNDNGTTYDSGEMNINTTCSDVAEKIIQYNSDYSTNTKEDVFSEWGYGIRGPPSGEVANGWDTDLNSDTLEFSHIGGIPGISYDEWKSTNQDPFRDMMGFVISIPKEQLDYNGDDIFDNEYEGITLTEVLKGNAFTATSITGTRYPADMKAYKANIPEPSLIGLAMIGILMYHARFLNFAK